MKKCIDCELMKADPTPLQCVECTENYLGARNIIFFKRLNGLKPTVQSCTAKVYEEIGELMQLLGKGQRMSGEQVKEMDRTKWVYNTIGEAFDGAQSLVTLINTMSNMYNIDLRREFERHEAKLRTKGYLVIERGLVK